MKVTIVNNGTSYLDKLEHLFLNNDEVTIINDSHLSRINSGNADLVVLSGGHQLPVMDTDDSPRSTSVSYIFASFGVKPRSSRRGWYIICGGVGHS